MKLILLAMALLWGASAEAAETVALRAAPHNGYGRIVFDWKTPAEYRAILQGRTLTIRFSRPFTAKLGIVSDQLPDRVENIRVEDGGQTVVATLKGDYKLRQSTDKGIVILDLLDGGIAARPHDVAKPEPVANTASPRPQPQSAKPDPLDDVVNRVLKPTPIVPSTQEMPSKPAPEEKAADTAAEEKAAPAVSREKAADPAPFVSVDVAKGRDISVLRFNWREEVGAAVFRRRGHAWVLFDAPSRIELGSLRINGAPIVSAADQIQMPGGSAVRLAIDPARHLRVRRERTVWVVEILVAPPAVGKGIDVVAEADDAGGRIMLPVKGAGKVLHLQDPEVGDIVQAVTLVEAGLGVSEPRRFVELEVLESAQGVAVRPTADTVTVEAQPTGVVVAKQGGLRVSRDVDVARRGAVATPRGGLYDFLAWAKGPSDTFAESRQELIRRAIVADSADTKRRARIALARFYVANGFGPEALGVINEIVRADAGRIEDVELRALRGAARVLAGDYALANDDFRHPVLEASAATAPWRATIAAARGDWKTAQQQFRDLDAVFDTYPPWLAARTGLLAAEASLAVGDTGAGVARIEALGKRELSPNDRDALSVLRGHLQKMSGDTEGALAAWRAVARSSDRKNQARARYALVNMQLERKEITHDAAIDQMERLRYAWRGDVHEFDLLRRLAQIYAERGDNRRALQTLKEAATYFRDIEGVQTVAQDMAATYRRLFAEGGADALPAVTALALFDEFRELTPAGAEGDALMRKFAERLAAVDLLDDAARLLDQQIKHRLKGEEKARVGLRAATLRLMDKKPEAALAALSDSVEPELSPALARERALIQSQALAAVGKRDEALTVLASDDSIAAERVRMSIHWHAKSWTQAADSFGRLIARTDLPEAELPGLVLSQAVALALAGDDKAVATLRAKHGELMKSSDYADAFKAVVGIDSGAGRDYRTAARITNDIAAFQALVTKKSEAGI